MHGYSPKIRREDMMIRVAGASDLNEFAVRKSMTVVKRQETFESSRSLAKCHFD
jgi:hypothetical protein